MQRSTLTAVLNKVSVTGARMAAPHLEPRRGTHGEAADYCRKDETREAGPWEHGHWDEAHTRLRKQGERKDLLEMLRLVRDEKTTNRDLISNDRTLLLWFRNHKAIDRLRQELITPWNGDREVWWVYGWPGTGKTKWAFEHSSSLFFVPSLSPTWFDGYKGEDTILLDNLKPGDIPWRMLMTLMDRYPMQVPVKGAFVNAGYREVVITSIEDPRGFFTGTKDSSGLNIEELKRRIKHLLHIDPRDTINDRTLSLPTM